MQSSVNPVYSVLLLFALSIIVAFINTKIRLKKQKQACSERTEGKLLHYEEFETEPCSEGMTETGHCEVYSYTVSGRNYWIRRQGIKNLYPIGHTVSIAYNPSKPHECLFYDDMFKPRSRLGWAGIYGCVLVLLLLLIVIYYSFFR